MPWDEAKPPAGAGAARPSPLPPPLSPLSPALSPPGQCPPCDPRGRCPQLCPSQSLQSGSLSQKGWMNPSVMSPQYPPIQGAKSELCPGPRVPVRGPGCPWSHSPCPQPRSPAAAFQACKTYWKSCGCKSWPPLRARNLSCNPERAAGSKHRGLPLAIPGLWNSLSSLIRAGGHEWLCGTPRGRAGVGQSQQILGCLPKTSTASDGWVGAMLIQTAWLHPKTSQLPDRWRFPGSGQVIRCRWDLPAACGDPQPQELPNSHLPRLPSLSTQVLPRSPQPCPLRSPEVLINPR